MKKENRQVWEALVLVFQFGISMIVPILLCTFLGVWLDKKLDAGWIVVALFFAGALAGFTNIYKLVRRIIKDDQQREKHVKKDK